MKIEAGKYYRTRDGRKVGPLIQNSNHQFSATFTTKDGNITWSSNGRSMVNGVKLLTDLVEEWVDSEHIESTKRMIEVMQAYVDGKEIEFGHEPIDNPKWNWVRLDYRIAETKTPDSINWDHVAPEFKYMARDDNGTVMLYEEKPDKDECIWYSSAGKSCEVTSHTSYRRGIVDWKDSLVIRPGCE